MNAHINREQEHGNWLDVEIFDAGTDDNPGALDERFSEVFRRYSDHMRSIAWGGKSILFFHNILFCCLITAITGEPEIIALCEMRNVNCVVWRQNHGFAESIFQCTPASAPTSTVHLNYVGGRHYEFTDIALVHLKC